MKKLFLVLGVLACFSCADKRGADEPLVAAIEDLNGKFSPFTGETAYDIGVSDLALGDAVISYDRTGTLVYNGIEGETRNYNGTPYFYDGIANVTVTRDEPADTTTYTYRLREGVLFSDGTEMTADDIIFTLYVYCDPAYIGSSSITSLDILGLADYKAKRAANISGITKNSKYEISVITKGINASAIYRMAVQPAPHHYYGDAALYDYENNKFGFPFGDLSLITEKDSKPMGAGPYKFIEFKNKVVYFEANEYYWRGVPKTKNLQLKVTAPGDHVTAITTGTTDISSPQNSKERLSEIAGFNKDKKLSGDVITYNAVDMLGYGYIGLNAKNISVGGVPDSAASKNMRKGIATVLAAYRDLSVNSFYGDTASVINYPISSTSWAAPRKTDPYYKTAYSLDVNGNEIYTPLMNDDERYAAASKAALGFLAAAGCQISGDVVVSAPAGASLVYEVMIGGSEDHPVFMLLTSAKEALEKIGITLNIQIVDFSVLTNALDASTIQVWVAAWGASLDPDMYQVYHGINIIGGKGADSNKYMIADNQLDKYIEAARTSLDNNYRKELFRSAFDIILDWGVEVPVYQRQECTLFSTKRIKIDTLPRDMTTYWQWIKEIYNIETK
ncbi:MAG: ABC transporter substrate-binding protein [Termitinemataceae bacterium]|nr:MAG: ABC transporter substrate-binding protein [Termitinemataceae bacterium]